MPDGLERRTWTGRRKQRCSPIKRHKSTYTSTRYAKKNGRFRVEEEEEKSIKRGGDSKSYSVQLSRDERNRLPPESSKAFRPGGNDSQGGRRFWGKGEGEWEALVSPDRIGRAKAVLTRGRGEN